MSTVDPASGTRLPGIDALRNAAGAIAPFIVRTPLLSSPIVDEALGIRLFVKPENLQKTGSFKARGAFNFVRRHVENGGAPRFVAFSSGNHAQGLALAAAAFGAKATIVMPASAPRRKIEGARALGAEVELLADFAARREDRVRALVESEGATFVPPFDHADIVAGQGTVGLEIAEDLGRAGIVPDDVFVPTSGGGLLSGVGTAIRDAFPAAKLIAVEPEGFEDFAASLRRGSPVAHEGGARTICDGLMSPQPGAVPFGIAARLDPDTAGVADDAVLAAMGFLFSRFNLVAEPSGSVGVAALLQRARSLKGRTVVAVVSGGNVDPAVFARALEIVR